MELKEEHKELFEQMKKSMNNVDCKMDKMIILLTKILENFEGK
jgi:hypothetical protein